MTKKQRIPEEQAEHEKRVKNFKNSSAGWRKEKAQTNRENAKSAPGITENQEKEES